MPNNVPVQQAVPFHQSRHTRSHINEPQHPFACELNDGDSIQFRTRKGTFTAKVLSQREDSATKSYHFTLAINGQMPSTAILIRRKNGSTDEYLWNVSMRIGSTKRPWIVDTIDIQKGKN